MSKELERLQNELLIVDTHHEEKSNFNYRRQS